MLLAIALLAFPATSLAQSAGDNQYQDPLAGQGGSSGSSGHHSGSSGSGSGGSGSTGSTGSSAPAAAPATATPTSSAGTGTSADPTASGAQTSNGQLPRTGFDVILTVELGLAMLLAGLVSHRLLVLRDRR
jgi:glucan endo-1,3-beta-D-glucosidase